MGLFPAGSRSGCLTLLRDLSAGLGLTGLSGDRGVSCGALPLDDLCGPGLQASAGGSSLLGKGRSVVRSSRSRVWEKSLLLSEPYARFPELPTLISTAGVVCRLSSPGVER